MLAAQPEAASTSPVRLINASVTGVLVVERHGCTAGSIARLRVCADAVGVRAWQSVCRTESLPLPHRWLQLPRVIKTSRDEPVLKFSKVPNFN
jgi:hypothetical protein